MTTNDITATEISGGTSSGFPPLLLLREVVDQPAVDRLIRAAAWISRLKTASVPSGHPTGHIRLRPIPVIAGSFDVLPRLIRSASAEALRAFCFEVDTADPWSFVIAQPPVQRWQYRAAMRPTQTTLVCRLNFKSTIVRFPEFGQRACECAPRSLLIFSGAIICSEQLPPGPEPSGMITVLRHNLSAEPELGAAALFD